MIRADAVAGAIMGIGVTAGGDADLAHQVVGTLMVKNDDTENCRCLAKCWLNSETSSYKINL